MAYALIDYPNDKGVHAAKVMDESELGPDLSNVTAQPANVENGIIFVDANGEEQEGTMPIRTTDVEIDSLLPVAIPAGSYDGTTSAKLSSAAAAEVVATNIRQGAEILGVQGSYAGTDTLDSLNNDSLTEYANGTATSIRDYLFNGNIQLQSVSFPSAVTAGRNVFTGCTSLTTLNLPVLKQCGSDIISGCSSLITLNLPELVSISGLFGAAYNLTSANLPKLSATWNWSFQGWRAMTRIDLPSATDIGDNSFRQLSALETVALYSATIIRGTAFMSTNHLIVLVLGASEVCALTAASCFSNSKLLTAGTIYIPETLFDHLGDGTSLDYKAATNWSAIDAQSNITWAKIEGSPYEVTT